MEHKAQRFARHGARMFSVRVRDLRQAKGWTQGELAKRMTSAGYPMHQTTVAKLENAARPDSAPRPTSVEEMFALAAVFGVPVGEFFEVPGDDTQVRLELAGLSSMLARIADELDENEARRAVLREQQAATEGLYRDAERKLKNRGDQ